MSLAFQKAFKTVKYPLSTMPLTWVRYCTLLVHYQDDWKFFDLLSIIGKAAKYNLKTCGLQVNIGEDFKMINVRQDITK